MSTFVFLCLVFFPFIFSIIFSLLMVSRESFPLRSLSLATLFSFFAIIISSSLQLLVYFLFSKYLERRGFLTLLFDSFIYSGTIEEIVKFLLFYCLLIFFTPLQVTPPVHAIFKNNKKPRNQSLTFVMFFASCFAGFENISYIVFNINALPIRLISATFFHILVSPYYLKAISMKKNIDLSFLVIAILSHGTYNMLVMMDGIFSLLSFIIIFLLLICTYQTANLNLN